jgi:ribonuclease HIII
MVYKPHMSPKNSYTFPLSTTQQEKLTNYLKTGNYRPMDVPHTIIAAQGDQVNVSLYTSGKCVVQGKGAPNWVQFTLEPEILGEARLGYEAVHDPAAAQPHMGIDYVDGEIVEKLRAINVRDSKSITSDKVAEDMSEKIIAILGKRYAIVNIGPAAYNRMYGKMKNVNMLLAWGHARAIENLLEFVPDCPRALSDQFGPAHRIEKALMEKGKRIKLDQRPKAESDPAVAAASILARAGFIRAIRQMGTKYGTKIPKGASAQTKETAIELVKKLGPELLMEACKGHFKTADEVLAKTGHSRVEVPDLPRGNPNPFIRRSKKTAS